MWWAFAHHFTISFILVAAWCILGLPRMMKQWHKTNQYRKASLLVLTESSTAAQGNEETLKYGQWE